MPLSETPGRTIRGIIYPIWAGTTSGSPRNDVEKGVCLAENMKYLTKQKIKVCVRLWEVKSHGGVCFGCIFVTDSEQCCMNVAMTTVKCVEPDQYISRLIQPGSLFEISSYVYC